MMKKTTKRAFALAQAAIFSMMCLNSTSAAFANNIEIGMERSDSAAGETAIDAASFPDETFRGYVSSFDTDGNGSLSQAEADAVDSIDVSGTYSSQNTVTDLKGIEYFTKITSLKCSHNLLTSLDVTKNTALKTLACSYNQLTSLDLTNNTALESLECSGNQLTSIDLTKNTALKSIECVYNQFTSLDLTNNTALESIECSDNQLTSLDLSRNNNLINVSCSRNTYSIGEVNGSFSLSELPGDFDHTKVLKWQGATYDSDTNSLTNFTDKTVTYFYNSTNDYKHIITFSLTVSSYGDDLVIGINEDNFPDETFRGYVSSFDTDGNGSLSQEEAAAVTEIDVSGTDYSSYNVSDLKGIEYFTKLTKLNCAYNQLTSIDLKKNTALTSLNCSNNQLTGLDVTMNTKLTELTCKNNQITSLELSDNTALTSLDCSNNQITLLEINNNNDLTTLKCDNNKLSDLNLSNAAALKTLSCSENQVTSLDVSNNTKLTYLNCSGNKLTSLDVSKNAALITLNCDSNQLTSLDLRNNSKLASLSCAYNQLKSLDVRGNVSLATLSCSNNQLRSLDVSNNIYLTTLSCGKNQLTCIDISKNVNLNSFDVSCNTCSIIALNGILSLSELPGNFDPAKASGWQGATYDSATNSLKDFTNTTVTYTYDCGNGKTETFTLKCSILSVKNITVAADRVTLTYSDGSTEDIAFEDVSVKLVELMISTDIKLCIDFVNASLGNEDVQILTDAQMRAIEAVLAYDLSNI